MPPELPPAQAPREPELQPVRRPPALGPEPALPVLPELGRTPTCSIRETKPRGDRELVGVPEEDRQVPLRRLPAEPVARSPAPGVAARALLLAQPPPLRPALLAGNRTGERSPAEMPALALPEWRRPQCRLG